MRTPSIALLGATLLTSSFAAATPSDYIKPKPNLARWADFGKSSAELNYAASAGRRHKARQNVNLDGSPDPVPAAAYSPLPPLNGQTITKTVAQQINNDVAAVIDSFAGLPENVQNVLKTAISKIMNQQIYTQDPERQYEIVSGSILNQLDTIENSLESTLKQLGDPLDDTSDFGKLRECVLEIVAMGGITSVEQGSCLSQSGYTLKSLKDQFNTFVDLNNFVAPANAINDAKKAIDEYLNANTLAPYMEYLIGNATESLQNVVLTVAAKDRDATQKAFSCWLEAIQAINELSIDQRERLCNTGNGQGVAGSTLADLQEAFQSKANQYMGVLPSNIAYNVQRIGMTTLTLATGSYESNERDFINTAITSAVAATSGESATIVADLIKCLNTLYDADDSNTCNANSNKEILQHNEFIQYNYLAQFVSILPKQLVQNLNNTVQASLGSDTGPEAESLRQQLQALFDQASLGTNYEACEIEFSECVIKAATAGSVSTSCYEKKGPACQALPALAAGQIDSGSTYGDIALGLTGDGKFGGARHKRVRRAVRRLANDVLAATKRDQNPVLKSSIELLS